MKTLEYSSGPKRVEVQSRPFSVPTSALTPALKRQITELTERFAVLVWTNDRLVRILGTDIFSTAVEDLRNQSLTHCQQVVPEFRLGRDRIIDGKIAKARQRGPAKPV
jgi:hypothetical protein